MADLIRSDQDGLKQVAQTFNTEHDDVAKMLQGLKKKMEPLEGGQWIGVGAKQFFSEMNGQVIPAINRLLKALQTGSQKTNQIAQIMKKAEEEAQAVLAQEH